MAISQNFPNISPSLNLNFARSKYLDPRVTFTRTSSATRVNGQGLIEVVSADTPRFDHSYDSSTGTVKSLGLLIEESRTNLVTDTATDFNYSINNQIASTTTDIAPDGNNVLCKHDLTGGTDQPFLNCRANTTLSAGNTYTMSMWLKGTTNFSAAFAFVGETTSEIYSNTANITTTWNRFTLTFTLVATQTASRLQVFFAEQGEGKVISIWGAQIEQGAFATSYIPRTSGQQATRTADNARMTGSNFSSWYNQSEGTVLTTTKFDGTPILGIDNRSVYSIIGTGFTWQIWWESTNTGAHINYNGTDFDATIFESDATIFSGDTVKMISALKTNDFAFSQNGGAVQSDTSVLLNSDHNRIDIGSVLETNYLNGTIAQISYYSKRLTNDQLQNLTK
jgi:hypothetical protein